MITKTIRKYILNPCIKDVNLIIGALLALESPVYSVCQYAGEGDEWHIKRMKGSRNRVIPSPREVGSMWLEDPNKLCVDSSDQNFIDDLENNKPEGVRFLGEYRQWPNIYRINIGKIIGPVTEKAVEV